MVQGMTVIMVHGIWDTGAVFKSLGRKLKAQGHVCLMPSLTPNDGRHGIADLANKLEAYMAEHVPENEAIALIGFSMGSIISRYYLQKLGGHLRTRVFISISGPHGGTFTAYLYPGLGTRDMRFGSALLRELDASTACLSGLIIHSFWTPLDLMIIPAHSSDWALAKNHRVWSILHPLMLRHAEVHARIITALAPWFLEKKS